MNIIVGATGQVGSQVVREIQRSGFPVRAVVRSADKLSDPSIEFRTADLFHLDEVVEAFRGGTTVFVLTPENPSSSDILEDTKQMVSNYKHAIQATGIQKVVALSCIGAHIDGETGNVRMSRILEQEMDTLAIAKVFVTPSYYFSNWIGYLDTVKEHGVLPSFFSENFKIDMHSPLDLAKFIAQVTIAPPSANKATYELIGPEQYSAMDVATAFGSLLNKEVTVQPIAKEQWKERLTSVGFTENNAAKLSDMTKALIEQRLIPEQPENTITLPTTFKQYLTGTLAKFS